MKNNWQTKKLGEIFKFKNGRSFKKTEWKNKGLPIIRIQNLNNTDSDFNYFDGDYDKAIEINNDDLLFSWSGTVGSSFGPHFWNGGKAVLNQHIFKVNIEKETDKKYAFYLLKYLTSEIEKKVNGSVGLVHITKEKLNRFETYFPEINEQKRIVNILDEVFESIDKAKINTEWNLQNSKKLFETYLQNVFSKKNKGWQNKKLIDVSNEITDGSHFSPKSFSNGKYPYVTVKDIKDDLIDFDNCKYIESHDYEVLLKNGCNPNYNDLLFSKDGTIGKVSLVNFEKHFVVLSSLAIIRPNNKIIDSSFLKYVLKNPDFIQQAVGMKTGVAIKRIILKNLKLVDVSYPASLVNQQEIVKKLDELSEQTKKLEENYKQKLLLLDELKKSVLQKAFSGNL